MTVKRIEQDRDVELPVLSNKALDRNRVGDIELIGLVAWLPRNKQARNKQAKASSVNSRAASDTAAVNNTMNDALAKYIRGNPPGNGEDDRW